MEGNRRARQRTLKRCYQCSRLEEQLWAAAYEQVWPLIRRALARQPAEGVRDQAGSAAAIARRA